MQKRPPKRPVDGLLLLDKPPGLSSNQALQRARWLFHAEKAGHTGSLDPLATGVLPLCFGEASKFSRFLLDADKVYRATITFGKSSDTGDSEGKILADPGADGLTLAAIEAVLPQFRGEIDQIPPMFSALKHQGRPLYELARAGLEIEREARKVHVFRLEVVDFRPRLRHPELDIEVECSKGTYIRTLAMDIGSRLANDRGEPCGGLVSALRRTRAGSFGIAQCVTLEQLEQASGGDNAALDRLLVPVDRMVGHLAPVILGETVAAYFRQGQPVMAGNATRGMKPGDTVRVAENKGRFLGVAEILDDGKVAPRRLMASP